MHLRSSVVLLAALLTACSARDVAGGPVTTTAVAVVTAPAPAPDVLPVAATPDPDPPPAAAPLQTPLPVVTAVLALVDESRPVVSYGSTISDVRPLDTLLWYPAVPGRWPLVLFAHGYAVGPDPYASLCEAWAAAGYVVAAPRFPRTDEHVAGENLDESDLENQPGDINFVIEALLAADGPAAGLADPSRIAVAGHSDGGLTALEVAADRPGLLGAIALSTSPVGRPGENPPLLVVQGDEDDINGWEYGQAIYDEAVAPKFLVYLLGAGHLPPFEEGSPWETVIRGVTISFLDRYVAGRVDDRQSLLDDGEPGLATVEGIR